MSERSHEHAAGGGDEGGCPELVVRPEGTAWRGLLNHNTSRRSILFRRELGLPLDRPLIMTGHQAEFWHPGILAKYLAADAAARAIDADVAWLTVDQDAHAAAGVRYPARDADGRLVVRTVEFTAAGAAGIRLPQDKLEPVIADGLERIEQAMAAHSDEPLLAHRIAAALADLITPLLSHTRPPTPVRATGLARTTLFKELVERMRRDPERLCDTYNAAVARRPGAGVRPLMVNLVQDIYELPVWHITSSGARQRVYAEMLDDLPPEELAPRALLLTGLLRLAGCDLFVHGTGGGGAEDDRGGAGGSGGYDHITDEWLSAWLEMPAAELAPITVVTATCRLPMANPIPSPAQAARAIWLAHHAHHDPAVVGDAHAATEKRRLVSIIASSSGLDRAANFERLHALLAEFRERRERELAALRADAALKQRQLAEAAILLDRTWPFALYPESVLSDLRRRIEDSFAVGPR